MQYRIILEDYVEPSVRPLSHQRITHAAKVLEAQLQLRLVSVTPSEDEQAEVVMAKEGE